MARTIPDAVTGQWVAFRQTAPNMPPLFHGAGAPRPIQPDGRWNTHGATYAQYFALTPAGAWSECARYYGIRTPERARELRRNLWTARIEIDGVADLSTFERWVACGLVASAAVGAHEDSRPIGDWLRREGFTGVLSPSASLPGATNLTLFGEWYERVLTEDWDVAPSMVQTRRIPVTETAHRTDVPPSLLTSTVFPGQPHSGYEEWRHSRH